VLEPVGPLPASVYWRRRAVALGIVLVALLLLWVIWPGGGDGGRRNAAAVTGTSTPAPGEIAATQPSNDPGRAPDRDSDAGTGTGTGTVAPGRTATATPRPTATTPPPAAPKPCGDKALRLRVGSVAPAYPVGGQPVLTLALRNASKVTCTRDIGAALQEIKLYKGTQRLWSSNDCYPEGEKRTEVLTPNAARSFEVTWSGLGSRPKCAGVRTRVGAGTYTLVARLGTLVSPRTPFTLR
jgi:hypothetical protein